MYRRSVADYTSMAACEPLVVGWNYLEMDDSSKAYVQCRKALADNGFTGSRAVREFQAWKGLTVDGILGPDTASALGVKYGPATKWTGNGI
jgi:peptidoglycan hydrolase-like protein with peptidoglycan-binding domain